jgi:hypothetical protein
MEHVRSFSRYSSYDVVEINTRLKFPAYLNKYEFSVIVLHYTLFGLPICMEDKFLEYLKTSKKSFKIAFLQDEYRYWPERAQFLNECKIDCVYTLLESNYFDSTYRRRTNVKQLVYNLPGYVSTEIEQWYHKYYKPEDQRSIDVGYRGRRLPYYLGYGSQEKHFIGVEFRKRAQELGLTVDVETEEDNRLYGENWPRFIANCKAVIGVEAGVSVFDIDDEVRPLYARLVKGHPDISFPNISFEEFQKKYISMYENRIFYRTISPRHFEAASLKVCQILFEGKYSDILKPMKHYIPLKKDFSNFETVIRLFKDPKVRQKLTDNAYNDLIASKKYSYKRFISDFDRHLAGNGLQPGNCQEALIIWERSVKRDRFRVFLYKYWVRFRYYPFPGRKFIAPIFRPIVNKLKI